MKYLVQFLCVFIWVSGFVVAKGLLSTLACIIPFWSWYLVIDKLVTLIPCWVG